MHAVRRRMTRMPCQGPALQPPFRCYGSLLRGHLGERAYKDAWQPGRGTHPVTTPSTQYVNRSPFSSLVSSGYTLSSNSYKASTIPPSPLSLTHLPTTSPTSLPSASCLQGHHQLHARQSLLHSKQSPPHIQNNIPNGSRRLQLKL